MREMIDDQEQLEIALHQLASFKGLLEAMRRHLEETEPSLIPLTSESYRHRIDELQDEICDYLLRQRQVCAADPVESGNARV
jgi:hypothetical protein